MASELPPFEQLYPFKRRIYLPPSPNASISVLCMIFLVTKGGVWRQPGSRRVNLELQTEANRMTILVPRGLQLLFSLSPQLCTPSLLSFSELPAVLGV